MHVMWIGTHTQLRKHAHIKLTMLVRYTPAVHTKVCLTFKTTLILLSPEL